jgi:hypothetical protein
MHLELKEGGVPRAAPGLVRCCSWALSLTSEKFFEPISYLSFTNVAGSV